MGAPEAEGGAMEGVELGTTDTVEVGIIEEAGELPPTFWIEND